MNVIQMIESLSGWQIHAVAFWILLQGAVVSVAPEEVVILTLGMLWGREKIGFFEAWLVIAGGLLPANLFMVFVGSRIAGRVGNKPLVIFARRFLDRYGPAAIFLTRFTPTIRGPVYLAVGLSRFPLTRFFRWDASASLVQIPALLWAGRTISLRSGSIEEAYRWIGVIAGILVASALLVGVVSRVGRLRRQSA